MQNRSYSVFFSKSKNRNEESWPSFVLFILLVFPVLVNPVMSSIFSGVIIIVSFVVWSTSKMTFPRYILIVLLPFLVIASIGSIGILSHLKYDVFKDAWYVINPVLIILTGFVLMYRLQDLRRLIRVFVIAGFLTSLLHLMQFAFHPELLTMPTNDLRNFAGRGHMISILSMGLLIVSWRMKYRIFSLGRGIEYILFMICSISFALSYSRELTVSLVLLIGSIYGVINLANTKMVIRISVMGSAVLALVLLMPAPKYVSVDTSFFDKIIYSVQEMKIKDYTSLRDININWRGYESARALVTYEKGDILQYLFGQGFGTLIDLGLYIPLGDEVIRFAPILHNGYMYLLVKTGVIGVLIYLVFLYKLVRIGTQHSVVTFDEERYTGRIIVGLSCVFFVSTFVVSGLFNKSVFITSEFLLGAMLAHASRLSGLVPKCRKTGLVNSTLVRFG
jgi:O-antigen ligase